jgi:hypothetical protein
MNTTLNSAHTHTHTRAHPIRRFPVPKVRFDRYPRGAMEAWAERVAGDTFDPDVRARFVSTGLRERRTVTHVYGLEHSLTSWRGLYVGDGGGGSGGGVGGGGVGGGESGGGGGDVVRWLRSRLLEDARQRECLLGIAARGEEYCERAEQRENVRGGGASEAKKTCGASWGGHGKPSCPS